MSEPLGSCVTTGSTVPDRPKVKEFTIRLRSSKSLWNWSRVEDIELFGFMTLIAQLILAETFLKKDEKANVLIKSVFPVFLALYQD
jgi:hypothetical protein